MRRRRKRPGIGRTLGSHPVGRISKKLARWAIFSKLAGPAGFEPANAGTKTQCLTAWRRPNLQDILTRRPRKRKSPWYNKHKMNLSQKQKDNYPTLSKAYYISYLLFVTATILISISWEIDFFPCMSDPLCSSAFISGFSGSFVFGAASLVLAIILFCKTKNKQLSYQNHATNIATRYGLLAQAIGAIMLYATNNIEIEPVYNGPFGVASFLLITVIGIVHVAYILIKKKPGAR